MILISTAFAVLIVLVCVSALDPLQHVFREASRANLRKDVRQMNKVDHKHSHTVVFAVKQEKLDELERMLYDVSDPKSANYGKHWNRQQIVHLTGNKFAGKKIKSFLKKNGARVTEETKYGDYIFATAPISVWENLFACEFHWFQLEHMDYPITRTSYYSLPFEIHESVHAVFNTVQFPMEIRRRKNVHKHKTQRFEDTMTAQSYYNPYPGYVTPPLLNNYYNISNNTVNFGVSQAVYESGGQSTSPTDLAAFQAYFDIPQQPITQAIGGHADDANCNSNTCGEASLDVQYMMAVAQGANFTYYYSVDWMFAWIIAVANSSNPSDVYSISYGSLESGLAPSYTSSFNTEAMKLGAMGVTIVVASGDYGATSYYSTSDSAACAYAPLFPASSPYVTAVGATNGPENGDPEVVCQATQGGDVLITSGGGFSNIFPRPYWQNSDVTTYFNTVDGTDLEPYQGDSSVAYYSFAGHHGNVKEGRDSENGNKQRNLRQRTAATTTAMAATNAKNKKKSSDRSNYKKEKEDSVDTDYYSYFYGYYFGNYSYYGYYGSSYNGSSNFGSSSSGFEYHDYIGLRTYFNGSGRGYPDVALLGHNYVVNYGGEYQTVDGTSASTPVFGGMVTLLNYHRQRNNMARMGFMNPFLYTYASSFVHDITSGDNKCGEVSTCNQVGDTYSCDVVCCEEGFYATTGWDPVTGLGSVDYDRLLATALSVSASNYPTKTPTSSPAAQHSPTHTPTAKAGSTVAPTGGMGIAYTVEQVLNNVDLTSYDESYDSNNAVVEQTVAAIMGLAASDIAVTSVLNFNTQAAAVHLNKKKMQSATSAVLVSYTVSINNVYSVGYTSPAAAYTATNTALNTSIYNGQFDSSLQVNAATAGTAALYSATAATTVYSSNYSTASSSSTTTTSSSGSASLSSGAVVGIVIGVLAGIMCIGFVAFFAYTRSVSQKYEEDQSDAGSISTSGAGKEPSAPAAMEMGTVNSADDEDNGMAKNPMAASAPPPPAAAVAFVAVEEVKVTVKA